MRVTVFETRIDCVPIVGDIAVSYVPVNVNSVVIGRRPATIPYADIVHLDYKDNWNLHRVKTEKYVVVDFEVHSSKDLEFAIECSRYLTVNNVYTCFRYVAEELRCAVKEFILNTNQLVWLKNAHIRYLNQEAFNKCICIVFSNNMTLRCPYKRIELPIEEVLETSCNHCDYFDPYEYEELMKLNF